MKIISKFTDFYEYDSYRYGEPAPTPVWKRVDNGEHIDNKICKYIYEKYFVHNLSYNRWKFYTTPNSILLKQTVVGIYPYVYYVPEINIYKLIKGILRPGQQNYELIYTIYGEEFIECLKTKGFINEIFNSLNINIKNFLIENCVENKIIKFDKKINTIYKERNLFDIDNFVTEDKELFNKIGDPIFVATQNDYNNNRYIDIHTNCNLLETSFLKSYPNILVERDIYTELENFIWSKTQEPEANPSNETRIVNAGFDLKTSFRNM